MDGKSLFNNWQIKVELAKRSKPQQQYENARKQFAPEQRFDDKQDYNN